MSDIDDRMESQEAEYEMGLMREQERLELEAEEPFCRGCGKPLAKDNAWMEDGCPCNSPKGINRGNQQISDWRNELRQELSHQLERMQAIVDKASKYVELFNSDAPGIASAYGELAEAVRNQLDG